MPRFADIKREVGQTVLPPEEGRDEGLGLGELRATVGMTQVALAKAMNVDQARVSRFERQEDMYLSTLRDYVRAVGGQLEMLARFPDDRVVWIEPPDVEPTVEILVDKPGLKIAAHHNRNTIENRNDAAHGRPTKSRSKA